MTKEGSFRLLRTRKFNVNIKNWGDEVKDPDLYKTRE